MSIVQPLGARRQRTTSHRRLTSHGRPVQRPAVDLSPASAYEAVTRQMVESMAEDLTEIKSRTNNIFYIVIGSIMVDMFTRWLGGG